MITALFIVVAVLLWLPLHIGTGYASARRMTPFLSSHLRYREEPTTNRWGLPDKKRVWCADGPKLDKKWLRTQQTRLIWFWPVAIPVFLIGNNLETLRYQVDPQVIKQQQSRIAELERELGLGDQR